MTHVVTCWVTSAIKERTAPFTDADLRTIERAIAEGSTGPGGTTPAIELRCRRAPAPSRYMVPKASAANAQMLQKITEHLVSGEPGHNVALIVSTRYAVPGEADVLGVMFDRGWNLGVTGSNVTGSRFHLVSREGAAVFLDPIGDPKDVPAAKIRREAVYTAVHELGHMFNLPHDPVPRRSWMSQGKDPGIPGARVFLDNHREWLAKAAIPEWTEYVLPGLPHFGKRSRAEVVGSNSKVTSHNRVLDEDLVLDLSVERSSLHYFEPLQVDVVLRTLGKRRMVPRELDPGYDAFSLWITSPSGERRRFDSGVSYCGDGRRGQLSVTDPMQRDIPISVGGGGFTFQAAGEHLIEAEFASAAGKVVLSNAAKVQVKPERPGDPEFDEQLAFLTNKQVAPLVHFGSGASPGPKAIAKINDFLAKHQAAHWIPDAAYGLARQAIETAETARKPIARRAAGFVQDLKNYLVRDELGARRLGRAKAILLRSASKLS